MRASNVLNESREHNQEYLRENVRLYETDVWNIQKDSKTERSQILLDDPDIQNQRRARQTFLAGGADKEIQNPSMSQAISFSASYRPHLTSLHPDP